MLEMTIPGLSLPLSPTFSCLCSPQCGAGQRSGFVTVTTIPPFGPFFFLPADVLLLQLFPATAAGQTNPTCVLGKKK